MTEKRTYDSTVARIAGNIAAGSWPNHVTTNQRAAVWAVDLARAIIAEVERTELQPPERLPRPDSV